MRLTGVDEQIIPPMPTSIGNPGEHPPRPSGDSVTSLPPRPRRPEDFDAYQTTRWNQATEALDIARDSLAIGRRALSLAAAAATTAAGLAGYALTKSPGKTAIIAALPVAGGLAVHGITEGARFLKRTANNYVLLPQRRPIDAAENTV